MLQSTRAYGSGLYGMGLYGVSEFSALVEGVEYTAAWNVTLTLPAAAAAYNDVTLAVERVEIDASTTTDLPEGSRFQVGYPAMECSFTLSGMVDQRDASKTAAWLFGRYSTTSPLYHADVVYSPVTVDLGLYTSDAGGTPELIRKFTGVIDSYTVNDDGSVEFTCIDAMRAKLRSVPASPVVVTAPPYNAGLTSEFAIDAVLRAATKGAVSSWPPQRTPLLALAAGLRSSTWPELGSLLSSYQQPTTAYAPGAFGSALSAAPGTTLASILTATRWQLATAVGRQPFIEFWAKVDDADGAGKVNVWVIADDLSEGLLFSITTGVVQISDVAGGTFQSVARPSDGLWHYYAFQVNLPAVLGTGVTGKLYIDGAAATSFSTTLGIPRVFSSWTTAATAVANNVTGAATIEALQIQEGTSGSTATNYPFTPQAVLDRSLNSLTVVPGFDAGDPFQVIQQIADAESGVAGGYEDGIFRFYNRNTLRGITSQRDITSASSLTAIGGQETSAAGVVNHASVEFTPWTFAATRSTVWSATSAIKVGASSTRTLTVTTENLYANADTGFSVLPNGSGAVTTSRYRASTSAAGTVEHPGVTVTTAQTSGQTAVLTMVNGTNQDAWFVSPANYVDIPVGTPLLRLAALVVTQGDPAVREFSYPPDPTTTRFGDQATEITGDLWIQDDDTALQLATDIVVDQCVPRPNLTGLAIVPDPRIQLTDVVHILDPDRTGVDEYVRVFGYSIVWEAASDPQSAMTYDMTIDGRTLAAPGGWIMGVAGRSEIGSTAYVYNGA